MLWLGALASLLPGRAAGAPAELIFAGDLFGDLTQAGCSPGTKGPDDHDLATLAAAIADARRDAPGALVLGGPGFLGPAQSAAFLLASESGSREAARLARMSGIEVYVPGVTDFVLSAHGIAAFLDEIQRTGRPAVLSNVACAAEAAALCQRTARQLVLDAGGTQVGVLAVVPENLPRRVAARHIAGLTVLEVASIAPMARALRQQVQLLIVLADLDGESGIRDGIALASTLDAAGGRADLIYVSRLDSPRAGVNSIALSNGTTLIGAPRDGAGVTRVTWTPAGGGPGAAPVARRYAPRGPAPAPLVAALAGVRRELCRAWGQPVATLPPGGLDRAALLRVMLDAMRLRARADIALINTGAVLARGLPLFDASPAGLSSVLPFPSQVVRARVSGQALADALGRYVGAIDARARLVTLGLERRDGQLLVNGRPLDPTATYRVATIEFVAQGGNDLVPRELLSGADSVAPDIRTLVLDTLRDRGTPARIVQPVALERHPLWSAHLDVGLDLQSVTIDNPATSSSPKGYDRPQLSRAQTLAFKADGLTRVEMDHIDHLLQLSLRTQYGLTRLYTATMTMGGQQEWVTRETADLINLLLLYTYRGMSARSPRIPTPYASLGLETEFNRPDTRQYHHMELSAAFGARAALLPKLSAQVGLGLRQELMASTAAADRNERQLARTRFLLTATIELQKRPLVPRLGEALLGEINLTYGFTDPTGVQNHELRGTGKLHVQLWRRLYLTLGADVYLYQARDAVLDMASGEIAYLDNAPGVAVDVTGGLKVLLSGRRQTF
jgi:2',3'-cyclic-nucleotide 2'-phosphodiesterase (5'-nucleotidase family)